MTDATRSILRLSEMTDARPFELKPGPEARAALADALGVSAIRKLRFAGRVEPEGSRDWRLTAELGATVVQPCVVTFEPVTTRIDERVERRYVADLPALPDGDEIEMPEDDMEPLPGALDIGEVMVEALSLSLPSFPRAEGVEPVEIAVSEPGVAPLSDADVRPFAGLKSLRDKLAGSDGEEG